MSVRGEQRLRGSLSRIGGVFASHATAQSRSEYDITVSYWHSIIYRSVYGRAYRRLFQSLASRHLRNRRTHLCALDCGIGTGLVASSLCSVERDIEVYGVDLSIEMRKRARSRLTKQRIYPKLAIADVTRLPFRDSEMDLVTAGLVLEHVPYPVDALREFVRVTRLGATILLVATRPHAPDIPFRLAFGYQPFDRNEVLGWMAEAGIQSSHLLPCLGWHGYLGRHTLELGDSRLLLTTDRLILRRWRESDREPFSRMNTDSRVMKFFPAVPKIGAPAKAFLTRVASIALRQKLRLLGASQATAN